MTQMLLYDAATQSVRETPVRVPGEGEVAWVPLIAAPQEEIERVLRDVFGCHPLIVEDCVKLNQRPKLDRYDKHLLLTFFEVGQDLSTVETEHVIGPNYVITVAPHAAESVEAAGADFRAAPERFMSFPASSFIACSTAASTTTPSSRTRSRTCWTSTNAPSSAIRT